MKQCPCCKSLAFDDAEICYECMHPFPHANERIYENCAYESDFKPKHRRNGAEGNPEQNSTASQLGSYDEVQANLKTGIGADGNEMHSGHAEGLVERKPDELSSLGEVYEYEVDPETYSSYAGINWTVTVRVKGFSSFEREIFGQSSTLHIGRSGDNDVVIPDLRVSRHHAVVFEQGGKLWVKDLESRNMTFLDGFPVVGTSEIRDGSTVMVCSTSLAFTKSANRINFKKSEISKG